jgi:hypothetical protein
MNRRLYGLLTQRLDEAQLDDVRDRRDARGRRWKLTTNEDPIRGLRFRPSS